MSTTIEEILNLPIMNGAKAITDYEGLNNIVDSISVTDHFYTGLQYDEIFTTPQFLDGQIMITGFFLQQDVSIQRQFIKTLSDAGCSGLIIFLVGSLFDKVKKEVIEYADFLRLPLIIMPSNRYLYGDVISEVMKAIFQKQDLKNDMINNVLRRVANLPENKRSTDFLLEKISDYGKYSILLLDKDFKVLNQSISMEINSETLMHLKKTITNKKISLPLLNNKGNKKVIIDKDTAYYYTILRAPLKNNLIHYITIISKNTIVDHLSEQQIIKVIRLYFNIWGKVQLETAHLVQAIIKNEVVQQNKLADIFGITLSDLSSMYVFATNHDISHASIMNHLEKIKEYFKRNHLKAIIDKSTKAIIVFVEKPVFWVNHVEITNDLKHLIDSFHEKYLLFVNDRLHKIEKAQIIFNDFLQYLEGLMSIYPYQKIFSEQELQFVKECHKIAEAEMETRTQYQSPIEILKREDVNEKQQLVSTLSTYLLDSKNLQEASEILFVHPSTVKYRIRKINEMLGYDIRKMPESYFIYLGIGVERLLNQS